MLKPDMYAYGTLRISGVPEAVEEEGYTLDLYVTLRNVLGEELLSYITRAPFCNGLHTQRVPHHSEAARCSLDSWMSFPHGVTGPCSVTYRTHTEKDQ
jgi:hypothetical protein